jgi:hypothetical protein
MKSFPEYGEKKNYTCIQNGNYSRIDSDESVPGYSMKLMPEYHGTFPGKQTDLFPITLSNDLIKRWENLHINCYI